MCQSSIHDTQKILLNYLFSWESKKKKAPIKHIVLHNFKKGRSLNDHFKYSESKHISVYGLPSKYI